MANTVLELRVGEGRGSDPPHLTLTRAGLPFCLETLGSAVAWGGGGLHREGRARLPMSVYVFILSSLSLGHSPPLGSALDFSGCEDLLTRESLVEPRLGLCLCPTK